MTTTNFSIDDDFIGIKYEDKYLDLHNNYEFYAFTHDKANKTVVLNFVKRNGHWVPKDAINSFIIHFENVKAVYTKDHDEDNEYIEHDGSTIDLIGFSYDSNEIMQGPTDTKTRNDLPSLIFVFVTGKAIKITAETARLMLN